MTKYLAAYGASALVFLALDFVWLTIIAKDFYRSQLGAAMLDEPRWIAAGLFYLIFLTGLVVFAILPALQAQSWKTALMLGAGVGLLAYATYDLSNLATLKQWSVSLTVVDIAWGSVVSALAGGRRVILPQPNLADKP